MLSKQQLTSCPRVLLAHPFWVYQPQWLNKPAWHELLVSQQIPAKPRQVPGIRGATQPNAEHPLPPEAPKVLDLWSEFPRSDMGWIWVYFLQEDKCETPVIFHKPTLHSPTYLSPANNGAILNCLVVTSGYVPQSTVPNRNLSTLPFHRWANWGRRPRNEDRILQQHGASLAFITEVSRARLKKEREGVLEFEAQISC